jgi:hypothetical protein
MAGTPAIARRGRERAVMAGYDFNTLMTALDSALLRQCPNWLAVRRVALLDEGGDHVCLTTEAAPAQTAGPFRPLRISQAGHLKAGHGAEERPEPPTERATPA